MKYFKNCHNVPFQVAVIGSRRNKTVLIHLLFCSAWRHVRNIFLSTFMNFTPNMARLCLFCSDQIDYLHRFWFLLFIYWVLVLDIMPPHWLIYILISTNFYDAWLWLFNWSKEFARTFVFWTGQKDIWPIYLGPIRSKAQTSRLTKLLATSPFQTRRCTERKRLVQTSHNVSL